MNFSVAGRDRKAPGRAAAQQLLAEGVIETLSRFTPIELISIALHLGLTERLGMSTEDTKVFIEAAFYDLNRIQAEHLLTEYSVSYSDAK